MPSSNAPNPRARMWHRGKSCHRKSKTRLRWKAQTGPRSLASKPADLTLLNGVPRVYPRRVYRGCRWTAKTYPPPPALKLWDAYEQDFRNNAPASRRGVPHTVRSGRLGTGAANRRRKCGVHSVHASRAALELLCASPPRTRPRSRHAAGEPRGAIPGHTRTLCTALAGRGCPELEGSKVTEARCRGEGGYSLAPGAGVAARLHYPARTAPERRRSKELLKLWVLAVVDRERPQGKNRPGALLAREVCKPAHRLARIAAS